MDPMYPRRKDLRHRMESLGLRVLASPDCAVDNQVEVEPLPTVEQPGVNSESLIEILACHYAGTQLLNPDRLRKRLRASWERILGEKSPEELAEIAKELGLI